MRTTRFLAAVSCGVFVLVSGCSAGPGAGVAPSADRNDIDQSNVGRQTALPSFPTIAGPLDITGVMTDPCSGLTPSQLEPHMGAVGDTTRSNRRNGPVCSLHPADINRIGVGFLVFPSIGGPAGIRAGTFPFKEPTNPIAGYPAVHQAQRPNGPVDGECQTIVAVSDKAAIAVYPTTTNRSDPNFSNMCAVSDRLAELAVANLKGSSGG